MTAILLPTFAFLILANVVVIVQLFRCYAPTVMAGLVANLTGPQRQTPLPPQIGKAVVVDTPSDFGQRLAQYFHCNVGDLSQHAPKPQSKMPFWAAAQSYDGLAPKSALLIRLILIQIRRLVRRDKN